MKKNYFYAIIQDEFSLLLKGTQTESSTEIQRLQETCYQRHKTLCLHLLRDFITPVNREDLYEVSSSIFSVFSTFFHLSWTERRCAEQSVLLLSCDPFRLDETPLRRREDLWNLWSDLSGQSSAAQSCFSALDQVAQRLLITAIRNA